MVEPISLTTIAATYATIKGGYEAAAWGAGYACPHLDEMCAKSNNWACKTARFSCGFLGQNMTEAPKETPQPVVSAIHTNAPVPKPGPLALENELLRKKIERRAKKLKKMSKKQQYKGLLKNVDEEMNEMYLGDFIRKTKDTNKVVL